MVFKMWAKLSAKIESILKEENDLPNVGLECRLGNAGMRFFKIEQSVAPSEVRIAHDHLRMLEVEREILSYDIRRLYEAEADGKINESEMQRLVKSYKERIIQVKNIIQHDQSVVALYELERIQDDLRGLFKKHFDELNNKIGALKTRLGVETVPSLKPEKKKKRIGRRERSVLQPLKRVKLRRGFKKYVQK
jgi:hypothetical protein